MKSNEASTLNKLDYTFCKGTKLEFCQNFRQKCTKTRICIILIGIISRVGFSEISKIYDFTQVYELITPYNSAINVEEGIALKNAGICCYSVEFIHVTPLMIEFFQFVSKFTLFFQLIFYTMIDILCAVLVGYLVKFNLNSCQKKFKSKANCDVSDYFKKESTIDNDYLVDISIALYLLNPSIIAACGLKSTSTVSNLLISLLWFLLYTKHTKMTMLVFSLCVYNDLYPILLIIPIFVYLFKNKCLQLKDFAFLTLCIVLIFSRQIQQCTFYQFLESVYWKRLKIIEIDPNVGISWYMFAEMFIHFEKFFICVYQLLIFMHTLTISIRFVKKPMFSFYLILGIICLYDPYTSYSQLSLYLSLILSWKCQFSFNENMTLPMIFLPITFFMYPPLRYYWIMKGSTNSNFYYACNIFYALSQIIILTELMRSCLIMDYCLVNKIKKKNNKWPNIVL